MSIQITQQQGEALAAVEKWLDTDKQVFKLFGVAGAGKTTIAKFVEDMVDSYAYAAYTGKAAHVLMQKGCTPASTIHSMIYRAHQDLYTGRWSFRLDNDSWIKGLDLVIVDEASMVGPEIGEDLLRLARKVLVIGDPFQLPPVKDQGFFTEGKPDYMLTEIHRQAAENPIIMLSKLIREGGILKYGTYGDSKILKAKQFDTAMLLEPDQILVGKNDTRCYMNQQYRKAKGHEEQSEYVPLTGEKLICLRNNHERGFLNGQMYEAVSANHDRMDVEIQIKPWEAESTVIDKISTPMEYFQGREHELDWNIRRSCDEFTYAYAVTVHKFQGSQADNVMIFDQSKIFREHADRWRYTAVTRAAEKLTMFM